MEEYKIVNHDNILLGNIIYILRHKTKVTKEILLLLNLETILPNYPIILRVIKNYKKIGGCSNEYTRLRFYEFCKQKFTMPSVTSAGSKIKSSPCDTQCVATQTINIDTIKYISARSASRSKRWAVNFVNNKYKSLKIINASLLLKIDDLEKKNEY